MSSESSTNKLQSVLWWITSIAVSVLCCSVLFVLFASYLVEMKQSAKDNELRITAIEEREDRILAELEIIRKHSLAQATAPAAQAVAPEAPATTATDQGTSPTMSASPAVTTSTMTPAAPVAPTVTPPSGAAVQVPALAPTTPAAK